MRFAIALLLLIPVQALADAKAQRPPPAPPAPPPPPAPTPIQPSPRGEQAPLALPAGLYRTTSFATRFDGDGSWVTLPDGGAGYKGRYFIERDVIVFTTTPAYCRDERVSYRLIPDPKGFKLMFLADSCKRAMHPPDWVFVRVER